MLRKCCWSLVRRFGAGSSSQVSVACYVWNAPWPSRPFSQPRCWYPVFVGACSQLSPLGSVLCCPSCLFVLSFIRRLTVRFPAVVETSWCPRGVDRMNLIWSTGKDGAIRLEDLDWVFGVSRGKVRLVSRSWRVVVPMSRCPMPMPMPGLFPLTGVPVLVRTAKEDTGNPEE